MTRRARITPDQVGLPVSGGRRVPGLRRSVLIEGAGHWVQQERPDEVNVALLEFLRGL